MTDASVTSSAASTAHRHRRWSVRVWRRGVPRGAEKWAIGSVGQTLKRTLDIAGSLTGLALAGPPVLLIVLLLKLCSHGMKLKAETRVGLGGQRFRAYRLCIGRGWWAGWWRQLGFDRTMWLLNVLRGEMSLVGPWPERVECVEGADVESNHPDRQRVRPGLFGWAQVNGVSHHAPAAVRLEYDLYYIRNWSVWLDLFILAIVPFRLLVRRHGF